jgi:phenylacetate-CoA ligase
MSAMNTEHLSHLESRDPAEREAALLAALPAQVRPRRPCLRWRKFLAGVDADAVTTRAALAALPVTRKHALLEQQQASRASATGWDAFGGFSAIGWRALGTARAAQRVFQSPGPIYEPEGSGADYWRMARAMFAAGFRAGDLVHNSFSYHLTPGAWIMESGAHALGCTVFPVAWATPNCNCRPCRTCGPTLRRHAQLPAHPAGKGGRNRRGPAQPEEGLGQRRGLSAVAARLAGRTRCRRPTRPMPRPTWALIAYETPARQGLVVDEGVIVEIVRPGTGDPVPDGEVGEVVVTVLNPDYPLLRFGTGDLSAVLAGPCPTGRSNTRIKGWMGRADQTAKVRGMFVHPSQVAEVLRRHPECTRPVWWSRARWPTTA